MISGAFVFVRRGSGLGSGLENRRVRRGRLRRLDWVYEPSGSISVFEIDDSLPIGGVGNRDNTVIIFRAIALVNCLVAEKNHRRSP